MKNDGGFRCRKSSHNWLFYDHINCFTQPLDWAIVNPQSVVKAHREWIGGEKELQKCDILKQIVSVIHTRMTDMLIHNRTYSSIHTCTNLHRSDCESGKLRIERHYWGEPNSTKFISFANTLNLVTFLLALEDRPEQTKASAVVANDKLRDSVKHTYIALFVRINVSICRYFSRHTNLNLAVVGVWKRHRIRRSNNRTNSEQLFGGLDENWSPVHEHLQTNFGVRIIRGGDCKPYVDYHFTTVE